MAKGNIDKNNKENNILQIIVDDLNKHCGSDVVQLLGHKQIQNVDSIPTGSISIDIATGINGIPKGRITEIYGAESSGKTTLCLSLVKQCQIQGGICVFIDVEHALDLKYAAKLGINTDDLLVSQPNSGEQALSIVDLLVQKNQVDLIIIDSVAALVPQSEIEGEMEDASVGAQARMLSKGLRKIITHKHNIAIVFINQLRSNIGVMFGNPNITAGGKALKYYTSMRIELSKKTLIKSNNNVIGQSVGVKIVKNKNASPFTETEVQLIYGHGFNQEEEIVRIAVAKEIIKQKGAWYYYQDKQVSQGKELLIEKIKTDPEFKNELLTLIQGN